MILGRLKRLAVLAGCEAGWNVPEVTTDHALVADAFPEAARLSIEA